MTFQKHLNDLKWLLQEKGLMQLHSLLQQFASATIQGNVTGALAIGNIDLDAATSPGLTAALTNTANASGQMNLTTSTKLDPDSGYVPKVPSWQSR